MLNAPPEIVSLKFGDNSELVIGSYQDRLNKLVAYLKNLEDNTIEKILFFNKMSESKQDYMYILQDWFLVEWGSIFDTVSNSVYKFVRGEIPFYVDLDDFLYNRKHEKIYSSSVWAASLAVNCDEIFNISLDKCLFWQYNYALELYFDSKIIVFYNGHINREFEFLVEDTLLNDFKVTEDIIDHLKEISTFEEAVEYLRKQLIFYSL
jgi:hypothetical protein